MHDMHTMGTFDTEESENNTPCGSTAVDSICTSDQKKSTAFRLSFVGLGASAFVFQFDALALGVALPTIAAELKASSLKSFWANNIYLLCVVIAQPIFLDASEMVGRKHPLQLGLLLFFGGSLIFALGQHIDIIILGRTLQGVGGGAINILVETVVSDMTTLKERRMWLGLIGIPIAAGNALGLPISALLTAHVGWRWLGWINLPIIGLTLPLLQFSLHLRSPMDRKQILHTLKGYDWIGALLMTAGASLFVLPLSWGGSLYAWDSWRTLLPFIIGLLCLAALGYYERLLVRPFIPYRAIASRTAATTVAAGFCHGIILFTPIQYLPLLYQALPRLSLTTTAVYLVPCTVVPLLLTIMAMMAIGPLNLGYKGLILFSWTMVTTGLGLLALLDQGASPSMLMGVPIVWATGNAMLRLLILPIEASVKRQDDTAAAITQLLTARLLGGVVGLASGTAMFDSRFASRITRLEPLAGDLTPLNEASNAISFIARLRDIEVPLESLSIVQGAYLQAFRYVWYLMIGFGGLGLVCSLAIEEHIFEKTEYGVQRFVERTSPETARGSSPAVVS
ncbi:hypothetical protein CBER1_11208 [Cercospora berteroae]|uniref:Major facilitator superfamily (MFS) profile domain-containing protein n=1 Tax=Cercospora berteroae TaxID=357750 RepID=A0A2S6CME2_9PEZI|nr:hypothetical protein CBER1_11208 [Cercospora berteroae]